MAPGDPSIEVCERTWRACAPLVQPSPFGMRLEDLFATSLVAGSMTSFSLLDHANRLVAAKQWTEAAELSRAALASGTEFPLHWHPILVEALVELHRLDEATKQMPELVTTLERESPEGLIAAIRLHRAKGEDSIAAMLFHAGARWFIAWKHAARDLVARDSTPKDLTKQFAAWFTRWYRADATMRPRTHPHIIGWMQRIGKTKFGDDYRTLCEADASYLRDTALLLAATDEQEAARLVEPILSVVDAPDAADIGAHLESIAPSLAYRVLRSAIVNEGRRFFRYFRGKRVEAVATLVRLTLDVPTLAIHRNDAYAIATGYALVPNAELQKLIRRCADVIDSPASAKKSTRGRR